MTGTTEAPRTWPHWTEPAWVDVEGVRTAYRRKGAGEPLLYLHGAGLTRQWLPLFEELSRSFDVVVPEHPGFGDTPSAPSIEGFDDLVLHYDALLRTLGMERPHVVGHSLGGWIAADLAIFYPGRLASLTLIAAMGLRVEDAPIGNPFNWSEETAGEMIFNGVAGNYLEFLEQDTPIEQMIHDYGEASTLALLTWSPRYDYRFDRRLQRVDAPTLVLHAADDRFVPRAHAERWAQLIPAARLEIIAGADGEPASHVVILQQPEHLARLITAHAQA